MDLIDELRRKINGLFYNFKFKQAFLKANQKKNIITKILFFYNFFFKQKFIKKIIIKKVIKK